MMKDFYELKHAEKPKIILQKWRNVTPLKHKKQANS
jgi:hypothetical protein